MSSLPGKQRKKAYNAPLHKKTEFLNSRLDKSLRKKFGLRSLALRKGDKVKIMRGGHKGNTGTIESVDRKDSLVFIQGIMITKKDGTQRTRSFQPSNLMLTELEENDPKRFKRIVKETKKQ